MLGTIYRNFSKSYKQLLHEISHVRQKLSSSLQVEEDLQTQLQKIKVQSADKLSHWKTQLDTSMTRASRMGIPDSSTPTPLEKEISALQAEKAANQRHIQNLQEKIFWKSPQGQAKKRQMEQDRKRKQEAERKRRAARRRRTTSGSSYDSTGAIIAASAAATAAFISTM